MNTKTAQKTEELAEDLRRVYEDLSMYEALDIATKMIHNDLYEKANREVREGVSIDALRSKSIRLIEFPMPYSNVTTRVINVLTKNNIETVGQLADAFKKDNNFMLKNWRAGRKSYEAVKHFLITNNLI